MNADRAIALVLAVSVGTVLLLGVWLLRRAHRPAEPPATVETASTATPTTQTPTAAVAAAPPPAAIGYRLAGTVVGDMSYAIIEDPRGGNQLYRPGQTIPGLGKLLAVEADGATMAGGTGTFVLRLEPAPTATPALPPAVPTFALPPEPTRERPPRVRSR